MFMSIVNLPAYVMYWANETRYAPIADVMPNNRYKALSQYLHVSDNSKLVYLKTKARNHSRYDYVSMFNDPLLTMFSKTAEIEPEIAQLIEEQILPAKTKGSGV